MKSLQLIVNFTVQGQRNRPGRPGNCRTNIFDFSHELEEVASVYKDDIDVSDLSTQLEIFGTSFSEPKATIHEVIKCLQSLSASQRLLLEQVCRVGRLLPVMPAMNATSKRSFSVLRRLKSYLQSTMSQPRLNHVMVLRVYKELLDELDLYAVANEPVVANIGSVCLVPSLRDK